ILTTGFSVVLALIAVLGAVSLVSLSRSSEAVHRLLEKDARIEIASLKAGNALQKARRAEKDFLLYRNEFGFEESRARYVTRFRTQVAEVTSAMAEIRSL